MLEIDIVLLFIDMVIIILKLFAVMALMLSVVINIMILWSLQ